MKFTQSLAIITICSICIPAVTASAFHCTVCHSKKPGMVRMHKALQGRSCFDCHKIGERLMGKGPSKDPATVLARRTSDPLCIGCHKR